MLKLLHTEALVYEKIKAKVTIGKIAEELNFSKGKIYDLISNLISLGVVRRSGVNKHYVYTPVILAYEIVAKRDETQQNSNYNNDSLLLDSVNVVLTDIQRSYIVEHSGEIKRGDLKRSELAKRLGLTKLQLNFALANLDKAQ